MPFSTNASLALFLPAKAVVEVVKDAAARDLDKSVVASPEEDQVVDVKVGEQVVSQHQVHAFPLAAHHALLVQVNVHLPQVPTVLKLFQDAAFGRTAAFLALQNVAVGLQVLLFVL